MLFNSPEFIFCFLPITVSVFFLLKRLRSYRTHFLSVGWLILASLFFYGWWHPSNLWIILGSITFNYCVGFLLNDFNGSTFSRRLLLGVGISANLLLLGYFKYFNFLVETTNHVLGSSLSVGATVLPLAISFFTFQQIGYLVDAYKGGTKGYRFLEYALFVSFFPQLIAGPIVHHTELIPQFYKRAASQLNLENAALGLTIFSIGLFKKVIFADSVAEYADVVFAASAQGIAPDFFTAWTAAIAYSLQLYFDFSGYSDMAIGIAQIFGIHLPTNFNSPYKALNISIFWRRWHITLSNFLRDYLYIPLGGNRKGSLRKSANLLITMLLGGLWHGAGWTFIFWGGLHGCYLVVHNFWRSWQKRAGIDGLQTSVVTRRVAHLITLICVIISWVFFRAETMASAFNILHAMFGGNMPVIPAELTSQLDMLKAFFGPLDVRFSSRLVLLLAIACLAPNTQEWIEKITTSVKAQSQIESTTRLTRCKATDLAAQGMIRPRMYAVLSGVLLFFAVQSLMAASSSNFLYFNF